MSVPASKSSAPPKGTPPVKTEPSSSGGRVTEEEIRAVLMQRTPLTTNDLVSRFKGRLKSSEVRSITFVPLFGLIFQALPSSVLNLKNVDWIIRIVVVSLFFHSVYGAGKGCFFEYSKENF